MIPQKKGRISLSTEQTEYHYHAITIPLFLIVTSHNERGSPYRFDIHLSILFNKTRSHNKKEQTLFLINRDTTANL